MNPFQQIGELKKMRDQAMQIQRELSLVELEVEKNGVKILIDGAQNVKSIQTNNRSDDDIKEAVNEAIKKSQQEAAKKLAAMQGGLAGLLKGQQ
ncbi:MAG TPA: YbaB/EbfC family nucleoid-associated protein [Patescibacteria group bacterium]|nr:YbaB/EbfC family nucleoid-associated protein [Patescibacteria group bacterium]